jgi:catechol 2,3-dioxygenase-like lactoylglutathione lyase family enzyme
MDALARALKIHVALNVRDVDESIAFYRKLFALEPAKVRPGYAKFDVQFPPINLSLNQSRSLSAGRLSHLGIQVPSTQDVISIRQQWQKAGLLTRDEFQTTCCFALQDKTWVRDPDGNEWEVFVVLEDNLSESPGCCGAQSPELVKIGE